MLQHMTRGLLPTNPTVLTRNRRNIHGCQWNISMLLKGLAESPTLAWGHSSVVSSRLLYLYRPGVSRHVKFLSTSSDPSDAAKAPPTTTPKLLYKAPMGDLITRLKRVSITSCLLSVVGLPMLIYLKNGTWPDVKQLGLGGFAFVSATGSTLALHFVFGPYIVELYQVPRDMSPSTTTTTTNTADTSEYLYKATTRSILGLKSEILFDPLVDVTRYQGARPFANFVVQNNRVLYCHPELLDDVTRQRLLHPPSVSPSADPTNSSEGRPGRIDEGIQRRPVDEKDGFL